MTDFVESLHLSSDERARLKRFEAELRRWTSVKNLVSGPAKSDLWTRHILDSVQVQRSAPHARVWVDLGSGGGLPGIITAILLADTSDAIVHLVESDNRKCAFLRAVSRETGVRTEVHHGRIEDIVPSLGRADAVSARALAHMDQLVEWAAPLLDQGAIGVFPKGRTARNELTRLMGDCRFQLDLRPSLTDPDASIVVVRRTSLSEQSSETS